MDSDLVTAIKALPAEIQTMIIREKVKFAGTISLTSDDVQVVLKALALPFANDTGLKSIADIEVVRVNKFALQAHSVVATLNQQGIPSIVSTITGQTLTKCPEVRSLQVLVPNALMGADWNSASPVRKSLMFVQRLLAGSSDYEGLERRATNAGTFSNLGSTGINSRNRERMWEFCDWPRVVVAFP